MPRYDVGVQRLVTLSTAIVVEADTEEDAKVRAAQLALDGELTWQIDDANVWHNDSEEIQIAWIEEA